MVHEKIDLKIMKEGEAELPIYLSPGSSGADIKAYIQEDIVINPREIALVPTGLRLAIPPGYEIQVRPRSGLALKHLVTILNTPGTIDADYRGELKIMMINFGETPFIVQPGMRIAQLVLTPILQANFVIVNELPSTERDQGGFGHTGLH